MGSSYVVTVEPSRENWVRCRLRAGAHIASRPPGRSVPPWFLQPGWQIPRKCGITRDAINDVEKNYASIVEAIRSTRNWILLYDTTRPNWPASPNIIHKKGGEKSMKLSTFLIVAIVAAIAVIIVKSNPSENLLPFLSGESARPQQTSGANAPGSQSEKRFLLEGRVIRHFGDGHIIVDGTLTEAGRGGQTGQYSLVGRPDSTFLRDGTPINCEVSPSGDYQFADSSGFMRTVKQFADLTSAPGASRARSWMSEGNPLDRPAYGRGRDNH